jgi:hypothetical protein
MKTKALVAVPVSERPKKDGDYLTNNGNRHYWANCFWVPKGELKTYTVDSEITHWYEEKEVIIIDPTVEGREAVEFAEWTQENGWIWHNGNWNNPTIAHPIVYTMTRDQLYKEFKKQSKTP